MNQTVAEIAADLRAHAATGRAQEYVAACGKIQAIVHGAGDRTTEQRMADVADVLAALDLAILDR